MKIIRGRADARWLPSRHNFALFRLAAYLKMRRTIPEAGDVIMVIDRHQSAIENHSVGIWIFVTLTCYIAATLLRALPLSVALVAALPCAMVLIELPVYFMGVLLAAWRWGTGVRDQNDIQIQSKAIMTLLIAAAIWLSSSAGWVRFVAWQFLGFVALNVIAAVIVFLLRGSIRRLENAVGGAIFEL